jgi:hypothetical protein
MAVRVRCFVAKVTVWNRSGCDRSLDLHGHLWRSLVTFCCSDSNRVRLYGTKGAVFEYVYILISALIVH